MHLVLWRIFQLNEIFFKGTLRCRKGKETKSKKTQNNNNKAVFIRFVFKATKIKKNYTARN